MLVSDERFIARVDPNLLIPPILRNLVGPNPIQAVRFSVEFGRPNQEVSPDLAALIVRRNSGYVEESDPLKRPLLETHRQLAIKQGKITADDQVLVSITAHQPAERIVAVLNYTEATSANYHHMDSRFFPNFFELIKRGGYKIALGTMMMYPLDQIKFSYLPNYQTIMACTKLFGLEPMRLEFLDMGLEEACVKPQPLTLPHAWNS